MYFSPWDYPRRSLQILPEYLEVMVWINIHVCLPFTILVIALCFAVRLDHIPATYYVNLLVSNLIQIIILFFVKVSACFYPPCHDITFRLILFMFSGTASFFFRMIIALERFLFISKQECHFIRQAKGFVTFSLFAWTFSAVLIVLSCSVFKTSPYCDISPLIIFLSLSLLVFLICLAVTLKFLCTNTSISAKLKCRYLGILILLLVNYIVIIFPTSVSFFFGQPQTVAIIFILNLHSPLIDLFLFAFMVKWPLIKLLMCLCCCKKEESPVNDDSSSLV